jgi:hypothetical protein
MCASPLSFLRSGPPPPRVALLPDHLFFTRTVPVAPDSPVGKKGVSAEVTSQVELALESLAPFALEHMYHGYYWAPGSSHALVYAAYRRRFTAEQSSAWEGAELVVPAFATLFGAAVQPSTTAVLAADGGFTAVHWGEGPVPSQVRFEPIPPEATDEDRARIRGELLRAVGESKVVADLASPPAAEANNSEKEIVFRSGDVVSRLPSGAASAMDVRDKGDLAALRRAHLRDLVIWRGGIGCIAALIVMGLVLVGLKGGELWQGTRLRMVKLQQPVVDNIMTAQDLTTKIADLTTKRLLPVEMLESVHPAHFKTSIQFVRASTDGLYTLVAVAKTSNPAEVNAYLSGVQALPSCETASVEPQGSTNGITTFTLRVTFKPGSLKPEPPHA